MIDAPENKKMHHYMGIEMNNQVWNLLGKEGRNKQDDVRMLNFAKASLYHWKKSPQYEPLNEQRGLWMISHVYAILERGEVALEYAQETLQLTEKHEFKDFDLAYTNEAMARAYAASGNKDKCKVWRKKALDAGILIIGKDDKKYFYEDFSSEPWFGFN